MRKIKVLLADDEPVILRGLRKLLHWHELGLEIVGEAYDGKELREMMDVTQPDLIISDISMPGYTGIDIIREIHETNRNIKVVFISAFRDFSYAQDALRYGAVEYLVKPVDKYQLEQAIQKVIRLIGDQSQRVREKEMAVRFELKKRNDSIEELLVRMTNGDKSASAQLKEMGLVSRSKYITVCFGELDGVMSDGNSRTEPSRNLLDFAISNVLVESIGQTDSGIYFRKGELHGMFLQHDRLEEAVSLSRDFHDKLNRYVKVSFTIGVGKAVESLEEADISAQFAINSLQSKYFSGWNRVIEEPQPQADSEVRSRINDLLKKLVASLINPAHEVTVEAVSELMNSFRMLALGGKHAAVSAVYGAISSIRQELKEFGIFAGIADDDHALLAKLDRFQTFEQMAMHASEVIEEIRRETAAKIGNKEIMQLVQVKSYIEEHYAENITLESMAALVYMNPYYFSSFFKKHTGENFKQYLTEVRMKNGMRLLMQSDLMVYEIAERIGYNIPRQFSDTFKKRYGKLPLEYKQSLQP
jgi:two-component system response regulator YesN